MQQCTPYSTSKFLKRKFKKVNFLFAEETLYPQDLNFFSARLHFLAHFPKPPILQPAFGDFPCNSFALHALHGSKSHTFCVFMSAFLFAQKRTQSAGFRNENGAFAPLDED